MSAADGFYERYVFQPSLDNSFPEDRLAKITKRIPRDSTSLLDIGCGLGRNLKLFKTLLPEARLCGIDVAESAAAHVRSLGFEATACDASVKIPFPDDTFEVVVCGEVIEHVIDTDNLLVEIHRVLAPHGRLILTTPNLAYAPNRLLLLLGIQPLFTETSLRTNLGRGLKALGQGNQTEGHLKIFTGPAMRDILRRTNFEIVSFQGYSWIAPGISGRIDKLLSRLPDFAAGFVVEARPLEKRASVIEDGTSQKRPSVVEDRPLERHAS